MAFKTRLEEWSWRARRNVDQPFLVMTSKKRRSSSRRPFPMNYLNEVFNVWCWVRTCMNSNVILFCTEHACNLQSSWRNDCMQAQVKKPMLHVPPRVSIFLCCYQCVQILIPLENHQPVVTKICAVGNAECNKSCSFFSSFHHLSMMMVHEYLIPKKNNSGNNSGSKAIEQK